MQVRSQKQSELDPLLTPTMRLSSKTLCPLDTCNPMLIWTTAISVNEEEAFPRQLKSNVGMIGQIGRSRQRLL
jgi:hypothetical protein